MGGLDRIDPAWKEFHNVSSYVPSRASKSSQTRQLMDEGQGRTWDGEFSLPLQERRVCSDKFLCLIAIRDTR